MEPIQRPKRGGGSNSADAMEELLREQEEFRASMSSGKAPSAAVHRGAAPKMLGAAQRAGAGGEAAISPPGERRSRGAGCLRVRIQHYRGDRACRGSAAETALAGRSLVSPGCALLSGYGCTGR